MDLDEFKTLQRDFDERHGWLPDKQSAESLFEFLQDDAIGLAEETGEVCGVIKRLGIGRRSDPSALADMLRASQVKLASELIDVMIYLFRLLDHLDIDIDTVYRRKLKLNDKRFRRYERPSKRKSPRK